MKKLLTIYNEQGLHMRPSAKVVSLVEHFNGDVIFSFNSHKADAKNIMELMFLSLCEGDTFKVEIKSNVDDHSAENELFNQLLNLIEKEKFGEY